MMCQGALARPLPDLSAEDAIKQRGPRDGVPRPCGRPGLAGRVGRVPHTICGPSYSVRSFASFLEQAGNAVKRVIAERDFHSHDRACALAVQIFSPNAGNKFSAVAVAWSLVTNRAHVSSNSRRSGMRSLR